MQSMESYDLKAVVGERVRNFRVSNCYTQADFAKNIGISVNFLSEIENGKKGMSQETLYKLCEHFGLSADYILFGKEAVELSNSAGGQTLNESERKILMNFLGEIINFKETIELKPHIQ